MANEKLSCYHFESCTFQLSLSLFSAGKVYLLEHAEKCSVFLRSVFPSHLSQYSNNTAVTTMLKTLKNSNVSCQGTSPAAHVRHKRAAGGGGGSDEYPKGAQEELFTVIAHNLHYTSIAILSIFCIDVIAKMVCEGRHFCHEIFEVKETYGELID